VTPAKLHITPHYVIYLFKLPGSLLLQTSPLTTNTYRQCYQDHSFISKKQAISNSICKSTPVVLYLPGPKNKQRKKIIDVT